MAELTIRQSSFWHFNSIGITDGNEACLIDPGIRPEEISATAAATTGDGVRPVTHVVITHSHHDHIRGWNCAHGARVVMPRVAAEKDALARSRILAVKRKIDERLDVQAEGFEYPRADVVFDDHHAFALGELEVDVRFVPGHSDCTSVVLVPALQTLCSADYLVSPGLPYCRWRADRFEEALDTLQRWCDGSGIERVVPAHNDVILGRPAIRAALQEERDYFAFLRDDLRRARAAGLASEAAVRGAARACADRRGRSLGGRERQDLDNARRVAAEEFPEN